MPYLGNVPAEAYTNTVKDSFNGDGSTTAFTLSQPSTTNNLRVVVENVIQDPTVAYSCSGTTLTFTSAPPSGTANIYAVHLGPATMTAVPPTEITNATTYTSDLTVQGAFTSPGIDDNATSTAMTLDASGQLGIGTASPSSLLDVDKSQDAETNIEITNTNAGSAAQVRTKYTTDGGLFTVGKTSDAHPYAGDAYIYNVDNTNIRFATNDTERLRILSTGGITFNGDTAAANALDDYEWGTFTPSVGGSTSDPTQSYAGQGGYYVKVGNLVHVNGWIDFAAGVSAGSGDMQLRGLPFTIINNIPSSRGAVHLAEQQDFSTSNQGAPTAAFLENNGTTAYLQVYPNHTGKTGGVVAASAADIQSRSRFSFNCTYVTSA